MYYYRTVNRLSDSSVRVVFKEVDNHYSRLELKIMKKKSVGKNRGKSWSPPSHGLLA